LGDGLTYFRARYFDHSLGRFIGRDPNKALPWDLDEAFKVSSIYSQQHRNPTLVKLVSSLSNEAKKRLAKIVERGEVISTYMKMPIAKDGYQDGMNLYESYYVPNSLDPSGMDSPACDVGLAKTVMETQCILRTCAKHDKCYHDNNCNAGSWMHNLQQAWITVAGSANRMNFSCPNDTPCSKCNENAVGEIAKCTLTLGHSINWADPPYYDGVTDTFFFSPDDLRMNNSTDRPSSAFPVPDPNNPFPNGFNGQAYGSGMFGGSRW